MTDITEIVKIILTLVSSLAVTFFIPWIREKTSMAQREKTGAIVKTLVQAAEQLYGAGLGKEKLAYVTASLNSMGYVVNTDDIGDAVRAMIESAVLELTVNSGKE